MPKILEDHGPEGIDRDVKEIKTLGLLLVRYHKTEQDRKDLAILRSRIIPVRGYDVAVTYLKERYSDHDQDVLTMSARDHPFLPFGVVMEIAVKFLGDRYLTLEESFVLGRKIYQWDVCLTPDGEAVPFAHEDGQETRTFAGVEYVFLPST
jgi:hypothetical protein